MDQQVTNALNSLVSPLKGIELAIKRIADSLDNLVKMKQEEQTDFLSQDAG